MSFFYLLNLLNLLSFEARPGSEHLPYEEGIKTQQPVDQDIMRSSEHLPYEEGIKTHSYNNTLNVTSEHLPYEEGIKTYFHCSFPVYKLSEHLPYEEGIKTCILLLPEFPLSDVGTPTL